MRLSTSILCGIAAGTIFASAAGAAVLYDSGGFEASPEGFSPLYVNSYDPTVIGDLRGQDASNVWREATSQGSATGSSTGTAVVQVDPNADGGTQDVLVTRTNYDNRFSPTISYTYSAGNPIVNIDWSMNVAATTTNPSNYGPFFGIEAYDASSGPINRLAGFGMDATTGELLFEDPSIGGFNIFTGDVTEPFGTWENYQLTLNYLTQTATFFVNGVALGTTSAVDFFNPSTHLTDADISALQGDPVAYNPTGSALFDNYTVSSSAIPEPVSLSMMVTGAATLCGRRSRKNKRQA